MDDLTDAPRAFTKRPVTISAMVWNGHNINAVQAFASPAVVKKDGERLRVKTLEGAIYASPGDYIIQGLRGEFYPCKPDIFEATYHAAALTPSPSAHVAGLREAIAEGMRIATVVPVEQVPDAINAFLARAAEREGGSHD